MASAANLSPILGLAEDRVRRMVGTLRSGGWVSSVMRGMTERRQHRWFLTSKAVDLLYTTDHQHPGRKPAPLAWRPFTHRDELGFIPGVLERADEEATWEGLHAIVRRVRDEIAAGI